MKKILVPLFSTIIAAAVLPFASAHEGHDAEHGAGGKEVVVRGELVDMSCYMAHEGKGRKHAACAKMCVLGGAPLGLVAKDGIVYLLVDDHSSAKAKKPYAQAKEFVAENVELAGDLYVRGGLKTIVVEKVEKR